MELMGIPYIITRIPLVFEVYIPYLIIKVYTLHHNKDPLEVYIPYLIIKIYT